MLDQKTICGRLAERCELLILALLVWSVSSTSEVSAKIEYIKVRLERFQDLLNNTNTAQNRDFQDLRKGACAPAKLRLIHMHIGKSERALSILWPFVVGMYDFRYATSPFLHVTCMQYHVSMLCMYPFPSDPSWRKSYCFDFNLSIKYHFAVLC